MPETDDLILKQYRFCNVFRGADRVSQHLIQHAAYGEGGLSEEDLFFRIILHRLFCRPSTWELLEATLGPPTVADFDPVRYDAVLEAARNRGEKLYTSAFILCANRAYGHSRKHQNHLALLSAMLKDRVAERVARARKFEHVYDELVRWPLIGPFMAYQLAIDLNYSPLTSFSENDFTMPGPGARRGLQKLFVDRGDLSEAGAIHWLVEQQETATAEIGLAPPTLFGRPLHAIDCQNLLCEVDKYCRVALPHLTSSRTTIKQKYRPDPAPYRLHFPPEWLINDQVAKHWRERDNASTPV